MCVPLFVVRDTDVCVCAKVMVLTGALQKCRNASHIYTTKGNSCIYYINLIVRYLHYPFEDGLYSTIHLQIFYLTDNTACELQKEQRLILFRQNNSRHTHTYVVWTTYRPSLCYVGRYIQLPIGFKILLDNYVVCHLTFQGMILVEIMHNKSCSSSQSVSSKRLIR